MANSIATAKIDVVLDTSKIQGNLRKVNAKLKSIGTSGRGISNIQTQAVAAAGGIGVLGTSAAATQVNVASLGATIATVIAPLVAIAAVVGLGTKKMFTASAEVETLQLRFINLGVSAEGAAEHMETLKAFTAKTKFELPDVAKASALLLQFSEGALGGVESLNLIGNAADVANKPIGDVALQVGKFYAALSGGGEGASESLNVLRDFGALTASATKKIKEMVKAEKEESAIFKVLTDDLEKRAGASQRSAETLDGVLSTMRDAWTAMWAEMGVAFEGVFKTVIKGLTKLFQFIQKIVGKIRAVVKFANALSKGRGISDALKIANTPEAKKETEGVGRGIAFEGGGQAGAQELDKLQERAAKFAFDRLGTAEKIADLKSQEAKLQKTISDEAGNNSRIEVKAKMKLFDIQDKILALQKSGTKEISQQKTMELVSLQNRMGAERTSFGKAEIVGRGIAAENLGTFAADQEIKNAEKLEAHNKKMETWKAEEVTLQREIRAATKSTVSALKEQIRIFKDNRRPALAVAI